MARGLPDDSNVVKEGPTFTLSDDAELAARLGSIVTFDRLGTVIALETFEGGLSRWSFSLFGTGSKACLSNYRSQSKGVSLKLASGTGTTPSVGASWKMPYSELTRLGYEASYAFVGTKNVVYHLLNVFKGTYYLGFGIGWVLTTGKVYYANSAGAWIYTGTTVLPPAHTTLFNKVKLVVNALSEEYERALINQQGISLKGEGANHITSSDNPSIEAVVQVTGNGTDSMTAYMDDGIITESEPGRD